MNIFEDLIDELKKENLLEETVIETNRTEREAQIFDAEIIEAQTFLENYDKEQYTSNNVFESPSNKVFDVKSNPLELSGNFVYNKPSKTPVNTEKSQQPESEAEFYRKRATDEVSCLEIVEHVLSGVEREQMKVASKTYDDLEVKKSLHSFLHISTDVNSPEHAKAEFQLMQETESWYSALSHRDKNISAAHLRRFCEVTRPVLSSQALVALTRFYRNSPYSESIRSKFDLIVTRLFTKDALNSRREIYVSHDDLVTHLTELYAEWESISIYSNEENDSKILILAIKFEDFIGEAARAESFDELIKNDFFNRLRAFKESTAEQFFLPLITATAIECNIKIGNRYIELLEIEKEKGNAEKLEDKYGFIHDQVISDATSKTFQLIELLKAEKETAPSAEKKEIAEINKDAEKTKPTSAIKPFDLKTPQKSKKWYAVNKWLLIATVLVFISSLSLFIWTNYNSPPEKISQDVKVVNLDNSSLKEYIKEARINKESFYAIVQPGWDEALKVKKEEILKNILAIGTEKGFKNVYLLNNKGIAVGSATENRVEVY